MQRHSIFSRLFLSFLLLYSFFTVWGQTNQDTISTDASLAYPKCYYLLSAKADYVRSQEKNYEESVKLYEQAFALVPKALVMDYYGASITYALLKNKKMAVKYLEEAIRLGLDWDAIRYYEATWAALLEAE